MAQIAQLGCGSEEEKNDEFCNTQITFIQIEVHLVMEVGENRGGSESST